MTKAEEMRAAHAALTEVCERWAKHFDPHNWDDYTGITIYRDDERALAIVGQDRDRDTLTLEMPWSAYDDFDAAVAEEEARLAEVRRRREEHEAEARLRNRREHTLMLMRLCADVGADPAPLAPLLAEWGITATKQHFTPIWRDPADRARRASVYHNTAQVILSVARELGVEIVVPGNPYLA